MKRRSFIQHILGSGSVFAASCSKTVDLKKDSSWGTTDPFQATGLRIEDGVNILQKKAAGNIQPVLREEILDNPDAVFIIDTGISNIRDEKGKWKGCNDEFERSGLRAAKLIFTKGGSTGGGTFIKPNYVGGSFGESKQDYINNGWIVNPYFVAGFVDGLRGMGNANIIAGARGSIRHEQFVETGILDIFNAHNLPLIEAFFHSFDLYHKDELVWHSNSDGMIARKFPTYRPVFDKDTTFINIAHAHTHQLGFTSLTLKNLQGVMPQGYGHICDTWHGLDRWRKPMMGNFNRDYRRAVERSYIRHGNMGYKFWDEGGFYRSYVKAGGYDEYRRNPVIVDSRIFWHEQWAQRMMDTVEVMPRPYINIVDGIFGRGDDTGVLQSNFITVGRSMVAVDSLTSWLMGHDPREMPYLRIAKERGLGENDIEKIPLFFLDERGVRKINDYRSLKRTPMGVYVYSLKDSGARYY